MLVDMRRISPILEITTRGRIILVAAGLTPRLALLGDLGSSWEVSSKLPIDDEIDFNIARM